MHLSQPSLSKGEVWEKYGAKSRIWPWVAQWPLSRRVSLSSLEYSSFLSGWWDAKGKQVRCCHGMAKVLAISPHGTLLVSGALNYSPSTSGSTRNRWKIQDKARNSSHGSLVVFWYQTRQCSEQRYTANQSLISAVLVVVRNRSSSASVKI